MKKIAWLAVLATVVLVGCGERPEITDGDTIVLGREKIRMYGIDAPEGRQLCYVGGREWRCGEDATQALVEKVGSGRITCEPKQQDRYGRSVSICYSGRIDLNRWMVEQGWAVAYRQFGLDYVDAEQQAFTARRGIWNSEFVCPWDWRRGERDAGKSGCTSEPLTERPGCEIKGNITRQGERIYYRPGDPNYSRVVVDERFGQKWFCTVQEAEAAGWRPIR